MRHARTGLLCITVPFFWSQLLDARSFPTVAARESQADTHPLLWIPGSGLHGCHRWRPRSRPPGGLDGAGASARVNPPAAEPRERHPWADSKCSCCQGSVKPAGGSSGPLGPTDILSRGPRTPGSPARDYPASRGKQRQESHASLSTRSTCRRPDTKADHRRLMHEEHGAILDTMGMGGAGKGTKGPLWIIGALFLLVVRDPRPGDPDRPLSSRRRLAPHHASFAPARLPTESSRPSTSGAVTS